MELKDSSVLVTGGAGFIGSHLIERLHPSNHVEVVDSLSSGNADYLPDEVKIHEVDLLDTDALSEVVRPEFDLVFHLAANPDVRSGAEKTSLDLEQNTVATNNLLESMKANGVDKIAFTSTSTVYGEDVPMPTPETYGPLKPISLYGASKLGCEGLCTAYEGSFGFDTWIFRFANIVGERGHGVVPDFVEKLENDPERLEILGDGRQRKSYLHVSDCVDAMVHAVENADGTVYNIGSRDTVSVTEIAEIVSEEMGLDPDFEYTGGRRGWTGDVPEMRLSVEKLMDTGWQPQHDSEESVRKATREISSSP